MAEAANMVIASKGGIAAVGPTINAQMGLPIAGLISPDPAEIVASSYSICDAAAKALGSKLSAPFMTLSFMALLVIPTLKMSDKGLFDARPFAFVDLEG
jgi:adenine deaminase